MSIDRYIINSIKNKKINSAIVFFSGKKDFYSNEIDTLRYIAKNLKKNFYCLVKDRNLVNFAKSLLGRGAKYVNLLVIPKLSEHFESNSLDVFLMEDKMDDVLKNPFNYDIKIRILAESLKYDSKKENNAYKTNIMFKRKELQCDDVELRIYDPLFFMKYKGKMDKWLM